MRISLNWLKQYVDINIPAEELIELIGSRLVEVEQVIDIRYKYDGAIAVKVVSAEKIPETHLTLCKVDDAGKCQYEHLQRDEAGHVQVLCGADNVHEGMMAAWLCPGATVPESFNTPKAFVLGVRKMLKKYDSFGMLGSMLEFDFGDEHDGIIELDPKTTKVGTEIADLFDLKDIILDIENKALTRRPDCFGVIGFAREVAGILGQEFKNPSWLELKEINDAASKEIEIKIEDEKLCPSYVACVLEKQNECEHKYLSLRDTLIARAGMRPVNDDIVNLSNYLMLLSGQPSHTFDYDKFIAVGGTKQAKIGVREAKEGEKLKLLDGKEIKLTTNDIVITSNDLPVGLAGAMGGQNTMVDAKTRHVLLESASFSLFHLRKTQMAHGIFSEAITRFTKGQPAAQCELVAEQFIKEIAPCYKLVAKSHAGNGDSRTRKVELELSEVEQKLGHKYSISDIKTCLENVGFDVTTQGERLKIIVPYWRNDIEIAEDIIEEVGRLNGYDNISPIVPLHATASRNPLFDLKQKIRNILAGFGANEILTYSFVHGNLIEKTANEPAQSYRISNSLSPDLQYLRQELGSSLLVKAQKNIKDAYQKFVLFEMNQAFHKDMGLNDEGVPNFENRLAIVAANKARDSEFYFLKNYIVQLGQKLNLSFNFKPAQKFNNGIFEPKRSAEIFLADEKVGEIGELKLSVARNLKLQPGNAVAELNLDKMLSQKAQQHVRKQSNFPKVERDLTICVLRDACYAEYLQKIQKLLEATKLYYTITPSSIYMGEGAELKKFSFHIELQSPSKTLTNPEITAIMDKLEAIK